MSKYVDVEEVKRVLCDTCLVGGYCEENCQIIVEMGSIKAADVVEVKHGKWKHRKNQDRYTCSVCSFEFESATHYCPNCGAKMDGGAE